MKFSWLAEEFCGQWKKFGNFGEIKAIKFRQNIDLKKKIITAQIGKFWQIFGCEKGDLSKKGLYYHMHEYCH